MKIIIKTEISLTAEEVFNRFNHKLFNALLPPSFIASAALYEGEQVGNRVRVDFKVPFVGSMEVEITQRKDTNSPYFFTDEGRVLPFPLKQWKHRHEVQKVTSEQCMIVDDITYKTANKALDILMYLPLYLTFYMRKPKYRKYFRGR
jgi:ligand-binding SRPBCC domain-containing protein